MPGDAVVFDLDDTLVYEELIALASFRDALALLPTPDPESAVPLAQSTIRRVWSSGPFHSLCLDLGISSWEGLWSSFEGNHQSVDGLRDWAPSYRNEAWSEVLKELGVNDLSQVPRISEHYVECQLTGHRAIEGSRTVVEAAATSHRLGLLTNGPSDIQRLKFEQSELGQHFDGITISGELGIGKPATAAFTNVLRQLGADPRSSIMVGDSWERDIVGATALGMSAVWVSWGRPIPAQLDGVTVVDDITQLSSFFR